MIPQADEIEPVLRAWIDKITTGGMIDLPPADDHSTRHGRPTGHDAGESILWVAGVSYQRGKAILERVMSGLRGRGFIAVLGVLMGALLSAEAIHAQNVVVGVNVVNPMRASIADQNTLLGQLKAAHVHVIRCGISADDKGIDFARRAAAQGIKLRLILGPQYQPNAPTRPYRPSEFPSMWSGHPLLSADPELSHLSFQKLLDALDANGIVLAGMELGNEINWAAFNPEFPLPGEGKILSLSDLSHDPEGKRIADGFRQYVKVLAALKEVHDHSRS